MGLIITEVLHKNRRGQMIEEVMHTLVELMIGYKIVAASIRNQ